MAVEYSLFLEMFYRLLSASKITDLLYLHFVERVDSEDRNIM